MVLGIVAALSLTLASAAHAHEIEIAATPRMEFVIENGAHANLVYHAVCFAGKISCTKASYQRLWKEQLGWSGADVALMRAFERAISFKSEPPEGRYPFPPNYPAFYEQERRERALIAALLDAPDLDGADRRAREMAGGKRARAIHSMLKAMKPRFDRWWSAEGERRSRGYARNIATVVRANGLVELSERVARLMGFAWQGTQRLRFHVIAHADAEPKGVRATQIERQAVLEATTVLSTESYVSISLHELFHYFYDSLPLERHVALMRAFAASDEKYAGAYYTLFNEALVSACAALVDRRLMPGDFRKESTNLNYSHPYIAPLARALFTIVPARFEHDQALVDGIVPEYLAEGRKRLGADADSLAFALMARGIEGDEALIERIQPALQQASPAIGVFTNDAKLLRHFDHPNNVRLRIAPGAPRFEVRERTAKSVEVLFAAPGEPSLEELIREKLRHAPRPQAR